jgi:hypothetical protein
MTGIARGLSSRGDKVRDLTGLDWDDDSSVSTSSGTGTFDYPANAVNRYWQMARGGDLESISVKDQLVIHDNAGLFVYQHVDIFKPNIPHRILLAIVHPLSKVPGVLYKKAARPPATAKPAAAAPVIFGKCAPAALDPVF